MTPPRGRKRKHNPNIPKHINQDLLPTGVYWEKNGGYWYVFLDGGKRRQKIASQDATLSKLHQLSEQIQQKVFNTFDWLSAKYFESPQFSGVSKSTKEDYYYCNNSIKSIKTSSKKSLADEPIEDWNKSLVQQVIDYYSDTPTKAKHIASFIRRVFEWGLIRNLVDNNPATGRFELPKERKLQRLPTTKAYNALLNYAKNGGTSVHYIAPMMEITFLCRLRGIEARTLTDANILDNGLHAERTKGSYDNIVEWNDRLRDAVDELIKNRDNIWQNKSKPYPMKAESRPLIVNREGHAISRNTYQSSWQRFIIKAIENNIITEDERFSIHDLKRYGVTETKGTKSDKKDASGHVEDSMLKVYDKSIPKVKPASD